MGGWAATVLMVRIYVSWFIFKKFVDFKMQSLKKLCFTTGNKFHFKLIEGQGHEVFSSKQDCVTKYMYRKPSDHTKVHAKITYFVNLNLFC